MTGPITWNGSKETDLQTVARYIEGHITANWQEVLETRHAKLMDAYNRGGDMAYGTYCELLFRPVHRQLQQAGLRALPKLPGDFDISREWGNASETDQQRWMWSTIARTDGAALGTIITKFFHDHTQFRVPRAPQVFSITETGKDAVVKALARRSADFARAREASIEIAEYLESLKSKGQ
jgi:hypothetical protein